MTNDERQALSALLEKNAPGLLESADSDAKMLEALATLIGQRTDLLMTLSQENETLKSELEAKAEASPGVADATDDEMAMAMACKLVEKSDIIIRESEEEEIEENGRKVLKYYPVRRDANAGDVLAARIRENGLNVILGNGTRHIFPLD